MRFFINFSWFFILLFSLGCQPVLQSTDNVQIKAGAFIEKGEFKKAEHVYEAHLPILKARLGSLPEQYEIYFGLCQAKVLLVRKSDAYHSCQNALDIAHKIYNDDDIKTINTLGMLGSWKVRIGDFEGALALTEKAIQQSIQEEDFFRWRISSLYQDLSLSRLGTGDKQGGITAMETAITYSEKYPGKEKITERLYVLLKKIKTLKVTPSPK